MTSAFCRYTASSQKCARESPHTRRRNPAPRRKITKVHSQISCFLVPESTFPVIIVRSRSPCRCQSVTAGRTTREGVRQRELGAKNERWKPKNVLPYLDPHLVEAERWLTHYRRPG